MKTIVLITYETSPYRGSEASVSWNYISHMNKNHKLIVVYGRGNDDVEHYLDDNTLENVQFIYVKPPQVGDGKGLLRYNLTYRNWHREVFVIVKEMVDKGIVDIIHYLNPIGFKEPGYLWKLDCPYVWGPIQGVANYPFALYPALSLRGKINALTRFAVHNLLLRLMPRVRKAMKSADAIMTVVPVAQQQIKKIYRRNSIYLPENAIVKMNVSSPISYDGGVLRLIVIGALIERKGVVILLEALKRLKYMNWHLDVVGSGPLEGKLKATAVKFGIDGNITWHGKIPRSEVWDKFAHAHLHVIPSLNEGNPTTLWEAMSLGVPTMTLDHCGMGAVVCEKCGIKIKIERYHQVVNDLAHQIENVIDNPSIIESLSKGVLECAKKNMWDEHRIAVFDKVFNGI